jgi:hypothetical protein
LGEIEHRSDGTFYIQAEKKWNPERHCQPNTKLYRWLHRQLWLVPCILG